MSDNEKFHDELRQDIGETLNSDAPRVNAPELPVLPVSEDKQVVSPITYEREQIEAKLDELHEFAKHPFKVRNDKDMKALIESITNNGVLTPIIIRSRKQGGYEIISGHRRRNACQRLGIPTIPAEIIKCNDDDAVIMMVSSNIQRAKNKFSEIVKACNMMYDAMSNKGISKDNAKEKIAGIVGITLETLQSFIDACKNIPEDVLKEILKFADEGRLPKSRFDTLTALKLETLKTICSFLKADNSKKEKVRISSKHVKEIREREGTAEISEDILSEITGRKTYITIKLKYSDISKYLPSNVRVDKLDAFIVELLGFWHSMQK